MLHLAVLLSLAVGASVLLAARPSRSRSAGRPSIPTARSPRRWSWGATEDEARQRAIEACKRLSKTCANGPAVTDDLKEVFAVVCCEQPRTGCAASAAANRRDAAKNAQQMFADAGYANCSVRHYIQAGTGKKQ